MVEQVSIGDVITYGAALVGVVSVGILIYTSIFKKGESRGKVIERLENLGDGHEKLESKFDKLEHKVDKVSESLNKTEGDCHFNRGKHQTA